MRKNVASMHPYLCGHIMSAILYLAILCASFTTWPTIIHLLFPICQQLIMEDMLIPLAAYNTSVLVALFSQPHNGPTSPSPLYTADNNKGPLVSFEFLKPIKLQNGDFFNSRKIMQRGCGEVLKTA